VNSDLDIILSEGESYTIEFKESADKSLPSEVCAFANASGGRVFIGVDDNGRVVGTDVSNAARSRIQDTINKIEPRLNVSISEGRVRYDEIVRDDLPIDELFNKPAFKRYIKTAKIRDVLEREAILKNLNCAVMFDGKMCFTNAGALFFRVNDEDVLFRHAGIVCALYKGTDKTNILDAKELNGDIVSNVDDAIVFLKKHLRISYKIKGLRRENLLELPEDALREAVVNAACHRDYFEKGSRIMVEIFDNRVDIVSPGGVCKGITPANFGTVTITRNPIIASMFFRIDYIEQMGTGIGRLRNATREANVAEPKFEFSGFFKVTFKRNEVETSIGRQSIAVIDRKRAVISYLEENGQARVADFVSVIGLSDGRVRALLREMVGDGTIEKIGDKRYVHYVLKS
jgi:ATP-dependent DNA helicase RecG